MDEDMNDISFNEDLIAITSFVEQQEHERSIEEIPFTTTTTEVPLLNCHGEDSNRHSKFLKSTFLRCFYIDENSISNLSLSTQSTPPTPLMPNQQWTLFNINFNECSLSNINILQVLVQKARMNIQILDVSAREDSNCQSTNKSYYELRYEITQLLFCLNQLVKNGYLDTKMDQMNNILNLLVIQLGRIDSLPIVKVLHTANCINGNNSISPVYHLLHGYLEWQWFLLKINYEFLKCQTTSYRDTSIEINIKLLIYDLVILSAAKYNRMRPIDLINSTPFICCCHKELWQLVQNKCDQLNDLDRLNSFWSYFNKILENLRDGQNIFNDATIIKREIIDKITPNNWTVFSIWLLSGMANLSTITVPDNLLNKKTVKDNYDLLNSLIKSFLNADPGEETIRINLCIISPILTEYWPPKTDILLDLWEYFYKKLNSTFYLHGSSLTTLAIINVTVNGYLQQIRTKLNSTTMNFNEISFDLFIYIFGKVLKRFSLNEESQIKKILSRITSKFSLTKLMQLNETGIHQICSVFLTLSLSSNLLEILQRIQNVLLQIPLVKLPTNRQIALLRGHCSLMIIFIEKNFNISIYLQKTLEQINSLPQLPTPTSSTVTTTDDSLATMKILAECFCLICSQSESFFQLGEELFFDIWLAKYLKLCSTREMINIFECINSILIKIPTILFTLNDEQTKQIQLVLSGCYKYILPVVLTMFNSTTVTDSSKIIADLAGNLCLCAEYCTTIDGKINFDDIFRKFAVDAVSANVQILVQFLVIILSTDKLNMIDSSIIMRNWIKCHICTNGSNLELKNLTNIIVTLDEFRMMCDVEATEIINARDPLLTFFLETGKSYENAQDFRKKFQIAEKMHSYLTSIEKYITSSLENPENTMSIFSILGIMIFHCAPIIYIRGKNSCFFNTIMFQYILPNHLLTGRPQKPHFIQAIHRIWHLLFMGIEKLDFKNDQHLLTILANLIEKWLPHFKTSTNKQLTSRPLIKCLTHCTNNLMITFIFDKISTTFLALQRRQPNQNVILILGMLQDCIVMCCSINADDKNDATAANENLIKLWKCCLPNLIEHAMMVDSTTNSKNKIFDLFDVLFKTTIYQLSMELKNILITNLKSITSKHLAYYSALYFQFMQQFIKYNVEAVSEILEHLKLVINNVEQMRGAGRDGKLRKQLDHLEGAVLAEH